jgi:hypothetical protein
MSTMIMIGVVMLLLLVYVLIVEWQRRRSIRQAVQMERLSSEGRVAEEVNRLRAELQATRKSGDRTSSQLARCRETLRQVLSDIEVLG